MTTEDLEALNDFAYRKDMVPCMPLLRKAVAAILMERVELKNEIEDLNVEIVERDDEIARYGA